jgi:Excreted virulence factor EspC, type VII ESX diderm
MSGELRVKTSDLRKLSEQHGQIASGIAAASQATNGTTVLVTATHGPVCAPTLAAIGAAGMSRDAAAASMQKVSTGLATKLTTAAAHYDRADQDLANRLNGQMQGR